MDLIAEDICADAGKPGRVGLDEILSKGDVQVVKFSDWKKIEQAEVARAREGAPREKFVTIADMIKVLG